MDYNGSVVQTVDQIENAAAVMENNEAVAVSVMDNSDNTIQLMDVIENADEMMENDSAVPILMPNIENATQKRVYSRVCNSLLLKNNLDAII